MINSAQIRWTLAVAVGVVFTVAAAPTRAVVLVSEAFSGTGGPLNGTSADLFSSSIASAGGSGTWVAGSPFLDDGTVTVAGGSS